MGKITRSKKTTRVEKRYGNRKTYSPLKPLCKQALQQYRDNNA